MIITQIQLENVGRHASIHFDSNAAVVGLLGPNGVGKSTILEMLKYALTGETEDSIDTYVRYGEGNAYVRVEFVKNGQKGSIFRQFGKTNKRKLIWNGSEKTSAREVDAIMAEIFAADKKAISNAVFVRQGLLEQILFSGDADRRSVFIKLVNMAFCAKRSGTILGRIKKLESTITDLGPMIQALDSQRDIAGQVAQKASAELEVLKDYSSEVEFCDNYVSNEDRLRRTSATIGQMDNERAALQVEIDRLLGVLNVKSIEEVEERRQQLHAVYQLASSSVLVFETGKTALAHYDRVSKEIQETRNRLVDTLAQIKVLNPDGKSMEVIRHEHGTASTQAELYPWRKQTEETLKNWEAHLQGLYDSLKARLKPTTDQSTLKQMESDYTRLISRVGMIKSMLEIQHKIAGCIADQMDKPTAKCPDCGLTIADTKELRPERLADWEKQLASMQQERNTALQQITQLGIQWNDYNNFVGSTGMSVDKAGKEIAEMRKKLLENVPTMPEPEAKIVVEITNAQIQRLPMLKKVAEQQAEDVTAKMKERESYQAERYRAQRSSFSPEEEQRLRDARQKAAVEWENWQEPYGNLGQTLHFMEANKQRTDELGIQIRELHVKLEAPMPTAVIELAMKFEGRMEAIKIELKNRNDVRQQAVGRKDQAQKNYDNINTQYQELRRRADMNIGKQKLIDDLKVLRDLLNDDGLPMTVVRHHFDKLAALTQEALSQLDTNFSILVDRDRPLAFKFVRMDDPVQYEMPMNKLSGGQKVRLCVAFLLACQRRLVKEVGLLVLDEPSNHIDQSGVESLAELLTSLQTQLKNTEMQVWCSDHSPFLADCFSTSLILK